MKKKLTVHLATILCAAMGWWGLLYPELTFSPDTVKVVCLHEEDTELAELSEEICGRELYLALLKADRKEITFRSKLWEDFETFREYILTNLFCRVAPDET